MLNSILGTVGLSTPDFLLHPLVLSLIVGTLVFIIIYIWSDKILEKFSTQLSTSQKDIVDTMDKLLITQNKESIIRNCWILCSALSALSLLLFWPNVVVSFIAAAVVFFGSWHLIRLFLNTMWESHCNKAVGQMVDGLTIMCNSLKVGLSLPQSMERVITACPGPLAKEFKLVLNKTKLGQNLAEALSEMADRLNRPDVDLLVSTINILKETGGNLVETFFVMAETLREKQKMDKKIKALTAQGRMQAKIMAALPIVLIGIFYVMDKEYISKLWTQPLGWVCLGIVFILIAIGGFVMKKVVEIKV